MENLKEWQKVVFTIKDKIYTYEVFSSYLSSRDPHPNDQIFKDLKLDKYKFFSNCYGYEPGVGSWPESKNGDYFALTKVVVALFPYCDEVTVDGNIVHFKSKNIIFKKSESSISSSKLESSDTIDFESIIQTTKIKLTFIWKQLVLMLLLKI